ncbi:MAG: class I SAM-dependent methyltransferase [Candidatus Latescibacterota bacterium]
MSGLREKLRFHAPQVSKPYSELAQFYDRMMDHVDYSSWANYISSLFHHFNKDVHSIFETACGTGSLAVELNKLGYELTCMDASPDMVRMAAGKFKEKGIPLRLLAGNMQSIPVKAEYDAAICIYDSINYMVNPSDFHKAICEAASVIRRDGLFVFDVCTVKNSELFFDDRDVSEFFEDIEYDRRCRYDPNKRIQKNFFIIRDLGKKQMTESHSQKIYYLEEVAEMIQGSDFREIGRFEDLSFDPGTEDSERVHFVLERR